MEKRENNQYPYNVLCDDDRIPPTTARRDQVLRRVVACLGVISLTLLALNWFSIPIPSFKLHSCHYHVKSSGDRASLDVEGVPLTYPSPGVLTKNTGDSQQRVPLEAHIMSKCPDAQDCIQKLVVPTMEQISDKVDFELSFIASVSNKSSDVVCKHGPAECIGNMLMLCAANLPFPQNGNTAAPTTGSRTPTIRSLGFANCLIGNYAEIPDRTLVEQCALEHGIDFDALNECASQEEDDLNNAVQEETPLSGIALLRKSALHSADLGVRTSCTVRLDETVWCVRDDGTWKDCAQEGEGSKVSVLVQEIEKLWRQRN